MTNDVLDEIYAIAAKALRGRPAQPAIQLHALPFRMTDANMARHRDHRWIAFWSDLKAAYDIFERTRIPPQAGVCNGRYVFAEASADRARAMSLKTLRPTEISADAAGRADVLQCPILPATARAGEPDKEARASGVPQPTLR